MLNDSINRMKSKPTVHKLVARLPIGVKARARNVLNRLNTITDRRSQFVGALDNINTMLALHLYETAKERARREDPKRLLAYGFKVYSQHDEDGIIEEIFRRIGSTDRCFVEFGVGDGLENNTLYCLLKGWQGVWLDGSAASIEAIRRGFDRWIDAGQLKLGYAFITAENVEAFFRECAVPEEFDLLSIDIDNNDYWVWRAIRAYRPRVVAVEYNASFQHSVACVVEYHPTRIWDRTNYYGASLKAFEELGREKGYCLVGCNYTGVTAFFVREDLVGDRFVPPYSAERHYQPPRYFIRMPNGHAPGFGPMVLV